MYGKFLKEFAHDVFWGYSVIDNDHPPCPKCKGTMNFHGGDLPAEKGYWDCDGCDFSFTEADLEKYVE